MLLSELCQKTGLGEQTVCLYLEEGLMPLFPSGSDPRTYADYYDRDADWLAKVAILRRAGFPMAAIRRMLKDTAAVPEVVETCRRELAQNAGFLGRKRRLLNEMERMPAESLRDAGSVAAYLQPCAQKLPLPAGDRYPRQPRLTGKALAIQEENEALLLHRLDQDIRDRRGKGLVIAIVVVEGVLFFLQSLLVMATISLPAGLLLLVISAAVLAAFARGIAWVPYVLLAWAVTNIFAAGYVLVEVTSPAGAGSGTAGWESSYTEEWEALSPEEQEAYEAEMEEQLAQEKAAKSLVAVAMVLFILYKVALCVVLIKSRDIEVYMYNRLN